VKGATHMNKGIRRKKDCWYCRAYWYDGIKGHCQLHYKIKDFTRAGELTRVTAPQEVCPKPRTYRDLARAGVR